MKSLMDYGYKSLVIVILFLLSGCFAQHSNAINKVNSLQSNSTDLKRKTDQYSDDIDQLQRRIK